jgi:hypothetical protein
MTSLKSIALVFIICFFCLNAYTQSLSVGSVAIEDYYRRAQLLGITDTSVSFTVRPIQPRYINSGYTSPFYPDTTESRYNMIGGENSWVSENGKLKTSLLPLVFQTQFNTHHPYGWNDGAMIPAKGLQTLISAGIFLQYGPLTFQFRPEIIAAANSNFDNWNSKHYDVFFARYYDIYNNIDLPVQFGAAQYDQVYWGQSSLRFNYKSVSFGISTENLWWGPGIRNSLLMSNTAPGFKHLTFNTMRPIKTVIGSFEGQVIGGRLENSEFGPLTPDHYFHGINLNVPKPNNWRYLAGAIITWQPKWIPGLFLGFDQSSQTYGVNLHSITDYLPLFSSIKKINAPDDPINKQDQRTSVFMRWLWPQEHAEIYFEWGRNNTTSDLTQFLLNPAESRAYIFGLRKLLTLNKSTNENIMIGVEVTQLQETSFSKIVQGEGWYVSKNIRQGYTNNGQILGAGIGPGGNLQSLDVSWVKGLKRIGLQIERYVHNNDAYYYIFQDSQDYSRHWVDMSIGASGEWNYKNLIFNAKLQGIKSFDYQWYLIDNGNDPGFSHQTSVFNVQIQAGVTYRF